MNTIPDLSNGFSRDNPSPRYRELLALYQSLHHEGDPEMGHAPEQIFNGRSLRSQIGNIQMLTVQFKAKSLLDYGAGKGLPYQETDLKHPSGRVYKNLAEFFEVESITCYDPAYKPYSTFPAEQKFDGVISTDVMEHCPEEDLPWILDEMFAVAGKFVFANVNGRPADRHLPNGDNAHCTLYPMEWWNELFASTRKNYPEIPYFILYSSDQIGPDGQYVEHAING